MFMNKGNLQNLVIEQHDPHWKPGVNVGDKYWMQKGPNCQSRQTGQIRLFIVTFNNILAI
jgi:hypothetical protein